MQNCKLTFHLDSVESISPKRPIPGAEFMFNSNSASASNLYLMALHFFLIREWPLGSSKSTELSVFTQYLCEEVAMGSLNR